MGTDSVAPGEIAVHWQTVSSTFPWGWRARGLAINPNVPTFNVVNSYDLPRQPFTSCLSTEAIGHDRQPVCVKPVFGFLFGFTDGDGKHGAAKDGGACLERRRRGAGHKVPWSKSKDKVESITQLFPGVLMVSAGKIKGIFVCIWIRPEQLQRDDRNDCKSSTIWKKKKQTKNKLIHSSRMVCVSF